MSSSELRALHDIKYKENRLDKNHPKYKTDKKKHLLSSFTITDLNKLRPSLIQKYSQALKENPNITWDDITISGSTEGLFIDTKKGELLTEKTYPYTNQYKNNGDCTHSFYKSRSENINYDKIKDEQRKRQRSMTSNISENKSYAKKIKVVIKRK